MDIISFIKTMDSDNSQNYKLEKLKEGLKDGSIYNWTRLVYDINRNFYFSVKSLPSKNSTDYSKYNLDELYEILYNMTERKLSRADIITVYESLSDDLASLFAKAIDKNLYVNVSNKLINKAHKEIYRVPLFEEFPYMRCSLMDEIDNIVYPAIAQLKSDGTFANIKIKYNSLEDFRIDIYSRNGKMLDLEQNGILINRIRQELIDNTKIEKILSHFKYPACSIVLMGELLVTDPEIQDNVNILDRQTGNGLITSLSKQFSTIATLSLKAEKSKKAVKELEEKKELFTNIEKNIIIRVWDIITENEWLGYSLENTKYKDRFNLLTKVFNESDYSVISVTEYKEVKGIQEANKYYKELIDKGEEGIILKNYNMPYKDGTSNNQIKFKEIKECDLLVTGYEMGSGQFKDGIGALICESKDKQIKVNVSGLTREMRGLEPVDANDMTKGLKAIEDFNFDKYNNKIITVAFNQVIKSKTDDGYSLFLPRIVEIREDKSDADTLDYIQNL